MRKIFTLLFVAMTAIAARATDYNVPITITINGVSSEQTGVITVVEKNGGQYDLTVKNFILQTINGPMGVGHVVLKGIESYQDGDATLLLTEDQVQMTEGDDPNVSVWLASTLPPVNVLLCGKIEGGHLRCHLDIDMTESLGQVIQVAMGEGWQMPNPGFEFWHDAGTHEEPNGWHSFESATGAMAAFAGNHLTKKYKVAFKGYKFDSDGNMLKNATWEVFCYYAHGDGSEGYNVDKEMTYTNDSNKKFTVTLPYELNERRRAQFQLQKLGGVSTQAGKNYDFSIKLKANQNLNNATVKLTDATDDTNFYFDEVIPLAADKEYLLVKSNMEGKDIDKFHLVFDFSGCQAGTIVEITDMVLKDHAYYDGAGQPNEQVAHSGEYCARIYSTSIFGIVANGTMTTGRLNAGSAIATDVANNAYLDTSLSDVDDNFNPFYIPLYSRPDSVAVWVKFRQGSANKEHPYATISAVITDGTYYQDPEDKAYTNVVAKAKNNEIATTDGEWVRVTAPFVYTENAVEPKAVLVTISTNADPGQGSDGDEVLVDDIEFVYNAKVTGLKIKGQDVPDFSPEVTTYEMVLDEEITTDDIEVTVEGATANVAKMVSLVDDCYVCSVVVLSADMSVMSHYVIDVKSSATAIRSIQTATNRSATYFTLDGRQVKTLLPGRIYICRQADGTVTKIRL